MNGKKERTRKKAASYYAERDGDRGQQHNEIPLKGTMVSAPLL